MIYGIGIDAVEIERVTHWSSDDYMMNFIFTADEIKKAFEKRLPHQYLSTVFAAKESFMKAVETGWNQGIRWNDIEIVEEGGRFNIVLYNKANELCKGKTVLVNCSSSKKLAIAFVVIFSC